MSGSAPEGIRFDPRLFDQRLNEALEEHDEFWTSYDEVHESFDAMGLQSETVKFQDKFSHASTSKIPHVTETDRCQLKFGSFGFKESCSSQELKHDDDVDISLPTPSPKASINEASGPKTVEAFDCEVRTSGAMMASEQQFSEQEEVPKSDQNLDEEVPS